MDFLLGTPGLVPDKTHHLHGSPVYWDGPNGPMLFVWGENESLRAWKLDPDAGTVAFVGKGGEIASARLAAIPTGMGGMTGGMLTLSSNGKTAGTGVVWTTAPIDGDANHDVVEGMARAYDATQLDSVPIDSNTPRLKLLWDSQRAGVPFDFSKFCPPVVADGKLLVTTYDGRVDIYGLNP
jgi:outer membrane protein assembly factor BamB